MDKYSELRRHGTNGANCGLGTDDLIARLKDWDEQYGIDVSDVSHDRVTVRFRELPEELDALAAEIYEFCPDSMIRQFGCLAEIIETMEEMGIELPDDMRKLVEGVDLEDPDYDLELLKRSLGREQVVKLWWD